MSGRCMEAGCDRPPVYTSDGEFHGITITTELCPRHAGIAEANHDEAGFRMARIDQRVAPEADR